MNKRIHLSKFLSLILRHHPERVDLELDPAGWAQIDELIAQANRHGVSFDRATLLKLVTEGSKKRFEISPVGEKIRARYGHSIPVKLDLEPVKPPATLYHGTAKRFWHSIKQEGLKAKGRNDVHLSTDREMAAQVGRRHGELVILSVLAGEMHADGYTFYNPSSSVWLVNEVPPEYLCKIG